MKTNTKTENRLNFRGLMLWGVAIIIPFIVIGCSYKHSAKSTTPIPGNALSSSNITVRRGDTLATVAKSYSRIAGQARYANPLRDPSIRNPRLSRLLNLPPSSGTSKGEVWVIERDESVTEKDANTPGTGSLLAHLDNELTEVAVPLKHTEVKAYVQACIATVDVSQQFHNPYDKKIEAKYIFPLPHNAAISEFFMQIGERKIYGIIKERKEAETIYREARKQGYVASLLTQERPNVFTQTVANIEPGKSLDVKIRYFHTLAFIDGWYEFVFPMVVGPRFNPPDFTNGIGAVSVGAPGRSLQETEVQYLTPTQRSGHDIGLTLDIEPGLPIAEWKCLTHVVQQQNSTDGTARFSLNRNDSIPNKDFVFRYRVGSDQPQASLITAHDERGGYFNLMLFPPVSRTLEKRPPMEIIFLIDQSGSMSGLPLEMAKQSASRVLRQLHPEDSFHILSFSDYVTKFRPKLVPATPENINAGLSFIKDIESRGGTMMLDGIKEVLNIPAHAKKRRGIIFLTDGYVGNDEEILTEVMKKIGDARFFTFGIGSSPNRYLMEGLARVGRGVAAYPGNQDAANMVIDNFMLRLGDPVLGGITIDYGVVGASDIYPKQIPDLYMGMPIMLTGRLTNSTPTTIRITGKSGSQPKEIVINPTYSTIAKSSIPKIWARKKIADLSLQLMKDEGAYTTNIVKTAIDYGLVTQYTSFVAVDSSVRTEGDHGISISVPVPVPEGVRYDTTVEK